MPRRPEISRLSRSRAYLEERIRMVRSAGPFATGACKPQWAKVWGE
jgi:hypothetical protein